jgi:transcription factor IIIB subunit 2
MSELLEPSRNVTFAPDLLEQVVNAIDTLTSDDAVPHARYLNQLQCPNCGSHDIEQPDTAGASVCMECGVVVEENAIVSAVEFVEGAGGASSMVGQYVSATSSKAYTGGNGSNGRGGGGNGVGRYGFSRDSRETTLANGRRRIQEVASRLRLGSHYVDAAHRLFTIAVEKNFVQGRRTTHVVAACLYIACRQEKSQHMLIDFSDTLQVNVYTLGTTFLKFRRLLGLKLEIIDPALYVYRFAAHLDLDEKANAVAMTALRLVGRMKRDWIVAGRRPAGICAAALLIASRAHGFSKHHQDVTRILRVCGLTVTTRVKEFEKTPSALLTLEQFGKVDLEKEADPPVFTKNKIIEARAKAIQDGNTELITSGALDDRGVSTKRAKQWRHGVSRKNENKEKFKELYESIEMDLDKTAGNSLTELDETECNQSSEDTTTTSTEKLHGNSAKHQIVLYSGQDLVGVPDDLKRAYPRSKFGRAIILPEQATLEEMQPSAAPTEAKISLDDWKKDMPVSIDDEIDGFFRSEEEEKQKELIFNRLNKDYIEQQKRKESDRVTAEARSKAHEEEDAAQAEGQARYRSKKSSKKRGAAEAATTEEQLVAAVSSRKVSRKINYDALSSIFDEDGSFSVDVTDDADADSEDPMFEVMR